MNAFVSRLATRLLAVAAFALLFGWGNGPLKADHPNVPVQRDQVGSYYPMRLFYDPGQKSRVSNNFDNFGGPRRVQTLFANVRQEDLPQVRVRIFADRKGDDPPRSNSFGHHETVTIVAKQGNERGNYVGELQFPGGRIAFFQRNPDAMLYLRLLD